jgi:tetratricopeptide (TPR) repeat protein
MKQTTSFFAFLFTLIFSSVVSAVDRELFDSLMFNIRSKEYGPIEKFLESNKSTLSTDPEYYVLLLNYVISKGDKTGIVVAKGTPEGGDFALTDRESGEVVGFIGSRGGYDEKLIVNGITDTQKALESFSSRLDIHFGIVSVATRIKRWDIVGAQLNRILENSIELDNQWTWGPVNTMNGNPKEFMMQNVLTNTSKLFHANTKQADDALKSVSETMIKLYPKELYGYANLGTLCLVQKNYGCAEDYYKQALEINPNDQIVLDNLAKIQTLQNK